ncbi:MAG: PBP1A family penicillin-binding protein [Clostridiales bacterium]|nr:PBP1A family penicillin-binding protein [Clostridiales bacterium]
MKNRDKQKKLKRSRAGLKIGFGLFLLLIGSALIAASYAFRFEEWRDLDPKLITGCPKSLLVYDRNGELVSVLGTEKRIWVDYDRLNKHTVDAFVSVEDARFYTHKGIDLYRIFGAAWADLKAGSYVQGASTISQQLIKLSHLSSEKTIDRKLEEAVLALQLEKAFDKNEIMEMYLNYIYFGGGYYGIEAASLGYFGVHAEELTTAQSAQLAGILKSPSAYAPHIDPEASLARRNTVLRLMHENGFIDDAEYGSAKAEECILSSAIPSYRGLIIDRSIEEAAEKIGITREELLTGGYSVYLAMDSRIEEFCHRLMGESETYPSEKAQGALVVLNRSGGIEAVIGGRGEYDPSGIDRASGIKRQPGSLIKPVLVYAPAIEYFGYGTATILNDEPTSFGDYAPRNSDDKYYGKVTLRTALAKSLNVPAVSVLADIGVDSGVAFASKLGIDFEGENMGLPLALGGFTHGVSPLEMAGAYSAFANGGVFIAPAYVDRIVSSTGETLYLRAVSGERVMSRETAYVINSMLETAASEGTAKRLSGLGFPIAAKTGTAIYENGVRDAWCAAYTPDYTAVIWMGTDSSKEGSLPAEAVGGNHTASALYKLFDMIGKLSPTSDFTVPDGITTVEIDLSDIENGRIFAAGANTPEEYKAEEVFVSGTEPDSVNPSFIPPSPPDECGWSIDAKGRPVISFRSESGILTYRILRADATGNEQAVCAFCGKTGSLSFTDNSAIPGAVYTYRIVAVHPVLKDENGSPLTSEPSRKMRVVTPFIGQ